MNDLLQINYLRSDKILFYGCIISFLLFLASIGIILISFAHLPPFIPVWNQLPWGDARLGAKTEIFTAPGVTGGVLFLNALIALLVYPKTPLLSRMLITTSLLNAFFGFLFIIRTVKLIL